MKINKEICIGCGTCVENCPVCAISMVDGKAEINEDNITAWKTKEDTLI